MPRLDNRFLLLMLAAVMGSGCAAEVRRLSTAPAALSAQRSFRIALEVGDLAGDPDPGLDRDKYWEGGLLHALRQTRAFSKVFTDAVNRDEVDLIVQGTVTPTWRSGGFQNFLTYFPGGIVYAPAWRGTRWRFELAADLQLIESLTGSLLDEFTVTVSHELVHRSGNPFHVLGAALVLPGIIRGATVTWPRTLYKEMVYDRAYPDLWKHAARQIAVERRATFLALERAPQDPCGGRRGQPPTIGDSWDAFSGCQADAYRRTGQRGMNGGTAEVYETTPSRWRVFVIDGKVAQWEESVPTPPVGSPPPR